MVLALALVLALVSSSLEDRSSWGFGWRSCCRFWCPYRCWCRCGVVFCCRYGFDCHTFMTVTSIVASPLSTISQSHPLPFSSLLFSSLLFSSLLFLPRLASPRLSSPRLSSPRLASRRLASPRLASGGICYRGYQQCWNFGGSTDRQWASTCL